MIFTASDVSSVSQSLQRWDWAEYISEAFVILACAGELVADLGENWLGEKRKKHLERRSTTLLVAALSVSLICLVRTNELSGNVIGSLGDKADEADTKAKKSIEDSSTALSQAKDALTKSGEAEDSSGRAEDKAEKAKISASGAMTLAKTAHTEANSVHKEVGKATSQLAQVESEAEKTKSDLINLAVCNAPRVLPFWETASAGIMKTSVDPLKSFAGEQVFIEFVPDAETRRAAFNIAKSLGQAGWKIGKLAPTDGINDGVEIQPFVAPFPPSHETREWDSLWQAEGRSNNAADAVVDFLHSYNWQAKRGWPLDENGRMIRDPKIMPPDSLRIRVGLYPPVTFVSPPGQKELTSRMEEVKREEDERIAEIERKQMESLPPESRKELQKAREEWKAENKIRTSNGPCQVLNPVF